MREYIRMHAPGGMFFLTLVTFRRRPILAGAERVAWLRAAFRAAMAVRPFLLWGAVVLPDHVHLVIELPEDDADFSARIALVKRGFSRALPPAEIREPGASPSRRRRRERSVWQRRFWEHTIRDERDLGTHMDYIHYNPVKHGYVKCPHDWPWSSFARWVRVGRYTPDWACACRGTPPPLRLPQVAGDGGE
jgi:putative transposase